MARTTAPKLTAGDRWGHFAGFLREATHPTFVIADAQVAKLHASVGRALRRFPGSAIESGEGSKSLKMVERLLTEAAELPRATTFLAIGGGTIGDLATVVAHLHKRGGRLVQVPTTLLAAVDSSLGGKGAVNLGKLKNGAGVFHLPAETWLCQEFFGTLDFRQVADAQVEAWKMAASLDARVWTAWARRAPKIPELIRVSRTMKQAICAADLQETRGLRQLLNFGHTFGHVLESLSGFRLSHGAAVRLGVVCALDVGRAMGLTPQTVAEEVERAFDALDREPIRAGLKHQLDRNAEDVRELLRGDKKSELGELRMVLLTGLGKARLAPVPHSVWRPLFEAWRLGWRP